MTHDNIEFLSLWAGSGGSKWYNFIYFYSKFRKTYNFYF